MSGEKLLPCPFCGGDAVFEECESGAGLGVLWSPGCLDDECIGWMVMAKYNTKGEAATAWNRRHQVTVNPRRS